MGPHGPTIRVGLGGPKKSPKINFRNPSKTEQLWLISTHSTNPVPLGQGLEGWCGFCAPSVEVGLEVQKKDGTICFAFRAPYPVHSNATTYKIDQITPHGHCQRQHSTQIKRRYLVPLVSLGCGHHLWEDISGLISFRKLGMNKREVASPSTMRKSNPDFSKVQVTVSALAPMPGQSTYIFTFFFPSANAYLEMGLQGFSKSR